MTTWCESYDLLPDPGELGNLLGCLKQQGCWVIFHVISMSILMEFLSFCLRFSSIFVHIVHLGWCMATSHDLSPEGFWQVSHLREKVGCWIIIIHLRWFSLIWIDLHECVFASHPNFHPTPFYIAGWCQRPCRPCRYRIPHGGFFDYATQAVYFCEYLGFLSTLRDKRSWGISTCFFSFSSYYSILSM